MSPSHVRRRGAAAIGILALTVTFAVTGIGPAQAAVQTQSINQGLSGQGDPITLFDSGLQVCDECVPDDLVTNFAESGFGAQVSSNIQTAWTSDTRTDVSYNDALLRQGTALDPTDTMTTSNGKIRATFVLDAFAGLVVRDASQFGDSDWHETTTAITPHVTKTIDIPCELPATGGSSTCNSAQESFTIASIELVPLLVDAELQVRISLQASVDSNGVVTVRKASVQAGNAITPDRTIVFSPTSDTQVDPLTIGCNQPVGNDLLYGFTSTHSDTHVDLGVPVSLWFGAVIHVPLVPDVGVDVPLGTIPLGSAALTLTAPDAGLDLGPVLVDNVPPTVDAGGPYAGTEGTALQFDGSGSSDNCGFPTLRWDFSDGGVAFGATPFHTFADNGVYSGLLTARDPAGNTSTTTFSVAVGNATPVPAAGPDGSAAWGRDVTFNGFGTDPGSGDQSTLTYQWDFGDGSSSPLVTSASGGYSVSHAYATPNTYAATLTVCDKDLACATDTRDTVVRKRTVAVAELGDTAGTYDTAGSLTGSITDEFGMAVSGRTLGFDVDGVSAGSAPTNGLGRAATAYTPLVVAGSHTATATFAGDSLYVGGSSSGGLSVTQKATGTAYTGALTGGANKTVVLSAVLKDATGKALAGRSIAFALGAQTASAITDANGVASVSLKLNQKNGTYALTATWTPTGADITHYVGSAASAVFKLQTK